MVTKSDASRRRSTFAGAVTFALVFLGALGPLTVPSHAQRSGSAISSSAPASAELGAEVFALNCSVCHGATGLGLDEAREAFPEDHRRCERCHRPGNPPTMSLAEIEARQHDLFSIGDPPPLRGAGAIAAVATPEALRAYLQAAMPRYRPGDLSGPEYDALTAFLLEINGRRDR
jgi:mono/diheme cytochrome c family protein